VRAGPIGSFTSVPAWDRRELTFDAVDDPSATASSVRSPSPRMRISGVPVLTARFYALIDAMAKIEIGRRDPHAVDRGVVGPDNESCSRSSSRTTTHTSVDTPTVD